MLTAALLATAAAAAPAAPARATTTPAGVAAATRACVAAVSPAGIDAAALAAAGFSPGSVTADGRALDTPMRFFGGADGGILLGVVERPIAGCSVVARVPTPADGNAAAATLTAAFGPPAATGREVVWQAERHLIVLNATGTDAEPALRVDVANRSQESQ